MDTTQSKTDKELIEIAGKIIDLIEDEKLNLNMVDKYKIVTSVSDGFIESAKKNGWMFAHYDMEGSSK